MTDSAHPPASPARSSYPRLPDLGQHARVRAGLGIISGIALFVIVAPVISQAVTGIGWLLDGRPATFTRYAGQAARFEHPAGMLGANLGIIALIPISIGVLMLINQAPSGWVLSVTQRLRWRYLLICLAAAVLIFGVAVAVIESPAADPASGVWVFLLIVLLTSPLQAAAEEVFFRGYLTQSFATLTGRTVLGIVIPALLFMFWHGPQNPALLASRLAFGLLAGLLVWATGGLEAAIAGHVANNLGSYLPALLSGGLTATRTVTEVTWVVSGYQIGVYAIFAAVAWLLARRFRFQTRRNHLGTARPTDARPTDA